MELIYFILSFVVLAIISYISDLVIKDMNRRNNEKNFDKTNDIYKYTRESLLEPSEEITEQKVPSTSDAPVNYFSDQDVEEFGQDLIILYSQIIKETLNVCLSGETCLSLIDEDDIEVFGNDLIAMCYQIALITIAENGIMKNNTLDLYATTKKHYEREFGSELVELVRRGTLHALVTSHLTNDEDNNEKKI